MGWFQIVIIFRCTSSDYLLKVSLKSIESIMRFFSLSWMIKTPDYLCLDASFFLHFLFRSNIHSVSRRVLNQQHQLANMLAKVRRLFSLESLLSCVSLRSSASVEKEGRCPLFFGRFASCWPPSNPFSAQLHCSHPSLSLVPLCGHTKTLFVLSLCLSPAPAPHPFPKLSPPKCSDQDG